MKILHIPYCFHPDPLGGTEIYVKSLVKQLNKKNIENYIAAPDTHTRSYQHEDFFVDRFAVSNEINSLSDLHGEGDAQASAEFIKILEKRRPDVVHFHAFTRGVSLRLIRQAKKCNIKTIFTYHTPTITCMRGTLLQFGENICSGELSKKNCSICTLHALGANKIMAILLNGFSVLIGKKIKKMNLRGGLWTALQMSQLIQLRHKVIYDMLKEVDKFVVLCEWAKKLLILNGVSQEKITLSRHGIQFKNFSSEENNIPELPLRIAFLGRYDVTKGVDILIKAIRGMPELPLKIDLYSIVQDKEKKYFDNLRSFASQDTRIQFLSPVSSEEVIPLLRQYHLLAVPSRWLETGPLVILEAFAAGIPVIGSDLGGIAELVEQGVNGILVKTDVLDAWKEVLRQCCEKPEIIRHLKKNIKPPRSMELVSTEMAALYYQLCQN